MTLCTLSSCNQHKVSQGQVYTTADSTAVEDTVDADSSIVDSDTVTATSSASSSSSTEASGTLAETAYNAGYEQGTSCVSFEFKLDRYTYNNDERLKEEYIEDCQNGYHSMKKEYASNRSMYKEYRRGFLKAYKDHEDAKNAL